jgi:hypothetical protein
MNGQICETEILIRAANKRSHSMPEGTVSPPMAIGRGAGRAGSR